MSKVQLINEIEVALKISGAMFDEKKVVHALDELLSHYIVDRKEDELFDYDNENYINVYLNSLKIENYSNTTLLNYRYQLQTFAKFLGKSLLQATTPDIRNYLAQNKDLKTSTVVTKMDVISSFYSWLVREEEIIKNPCLKIKRPKLPKKVRTGLTMVELEKVRNSCKTQRQRALIEVFYSTGCRLDELRKLNISDIDWVNRSALVTGKGNKERRVYLSDKALYYLKMYLDQREDECAALFTSERRPIRRLTNAGIQHIIKTIKSLSGIEKPLHPHIMRHTFAQLNLDAGMELSDLQALMGHENPATTIRYAQVSEERKQSAFKKFHAQ